MVVMVLVVQMSLREVDKNLTFIHDNENVHIMGLILVWLTWSCWCVSVSTWLGGLKICGPSDLGANLGIS